MKAYTNTEQSKVLAEILPIESADMCYKYVLPKSNIIEHNPQNGSPVEALKWFNKGYTYSGRKPLSLEEYCIPCWSLAALLDVLPNGTNIIKEEADTKNERYMCTVGTKSGIISTFGNNPVDACFEMVIKLHK